MASLHKAEVFYIEVTDLSKHIGAVIKKFREKKGKGFSQEWLARMCQVSVGHISQIEQGVNNPSIKTLARIAKALGVPLWKIIKKAEDLQTKEGEK